MEYIIVSVVISLLHSVFFQPLQLVGRSVDGATSTAPAELLPRRIVPDNQAGQTIAPFLSLPFRQTDVPPSQLKIGEGWYYSQQEMAIHGKPLHRSIDFDVARGTPVVAAADGYALRSYQAAPLDRVYQGKSLGFGLGEFVEVYHPQTGVYSLYGHLNEAVDGLPYAEAVAYGAETWEPVGIYVSPQDFIKKAKKVSRGEVIGYVGDSGIPWGYQEQFDPVSGHVVKRDFAAQPSWDDPHLHFEVYTRSADGRSKEVRYDAYGIYGSAPDYTQAAQPSTLWLTDDKRQPRYP